MAQVQLDHIVLLLPLEDLQNPPVWLTSAFTISPGGRHGDQKTENRLIVFRDNTYIELIAFTSEEARKGHWWGDKGYGIIDYAFTLRGGVAGYSDIEKRIAALPIDSRFKPQPLKSGSRTKPDGEVVQWHVAFPPGDHRGAAPFWCFDVTPRSVRVPTEESLMKHPCGAIGVGSILIFTEAGSEAQIGLTKLLDAVIQLPPGEREDDQTWDLATPEKISSQLPCQLSLMPAKAPYEKSAIEKGRKLVARLMLMTEDEPDSAPNVSHSIEGDEVRIGFAKA